MADGWSRVPVPSKDPIVSIAAILSSSDDVASQSSAPAAASAAAEADGFDGGEDGLGDDNGQDIIETDVPQVGSPLIGLVLP